VVNIDPAAGQSAPDPSTCLNLLGNLGRNSLIGPGRITLDFSVFKSNYIQDISRTFNVQFRAEIFNIFNRPNINAPLPNRYVFDSNGHPHLQRRPDRIHPDVAEEHSVCDPGHLVGREGAREKKRPAWLGSVSRISSASPGCKLMSPRTRRFYA
jgi:hypothetical protein